MLYLKYFIVFLILSIFSVRAQEINISVPFTQPPQLRVDAGADQILPEDQIVTLGNDLVIEGGTPDFSITWAKPGNVPVSGQTITADVPGRYIVQIFDSLNCSSVDSLLVTSLTSLGGTTHSPILNLYPNPSDGKVYFHIPEKQIPLKVEIISASGNIVYNTTVVPSEAETDVWLDLGKLPGGTYVFRVVAGTNSYNGMLIIR